MMTDTTPEAFLSASRAVIEWMGILRLESAAVRSASRPVRVFAVMSSSVWCAVRAPSSQWTAIQRPRSSSLAMALWKLLQSRR